ncbi:MAG: hypothetical protein Q9227_006561 [Pyrenula ochraceoflavens]
MNQAPALMTIPFEIRSMILKNLLLRHSRETTLQTIACGSYPRIPQKDAKFINDTYAIFHDRPYYSQWHAYYQGPGCEVQVLRVNRKLCDEGAAILYGSNVFHMTSHEPSYLSDFWEKFKLIDAGLINSSVNFETIQHIDISILKVMKTFTYEKVDFDLWYASPERSTLKIPSNGRTLQQWHSSLPQLRSVLVHNHSARHTLIEKNHKYCPRFSAVKTDVRGFVFEQWESGMDEEQGTIEERGSNAAEDSPIVELKREGTFSLFEVAALFLVDLLERKADGAKPKAYFRNFEEAPFDDRIHKCLLVEHARATGRDALGLDEIDITLLRNDLFPGDERCLQWFSDPKEIRWHRRQWSQPLR